jgi:hypothetical protein
MRINGEIGDNGFHQMEEERDGLEWQAAGIRCPRVMA